MALFAFTVLTKITQPSKAMLPVPKQMYQAVIHKLKGELKFVFHSLEFHIFEGCLLSPFKRVS